MTRCLHETFLPRDPSHFCHFEMRNISIIAIEVAQEDGSKLVHSFTPNTQSKSHDSW
jgi:hypothetical protein